MAGPDSVASKVASLFCKKDLVLGPWHLVALGVGAMIIWLVIGFVIYFAYGRVHEGGDSASDPG